MDPVKTSDQPVTVLLHEAVGGACELVRLEVELARNELHQELRSVTHAAVALGIAIVAAAGMLSMLALALVFALHGTAATALGVAGGLLGVTGVAGGVGYAALPRGFLTQARTRVHADVEQIKEKMA